MTIIGSNKWYAQKEVIVFDMDAFINDVYNRFCGTPNEESREDLQALWNKVLTMPRGGDASLYPNAHGPRPALLEVWHKAGDFWRANGFSKPARLLCDQHGIVIDEKTAQRIAAAKAAISGTDNATATEATETPQDAQADASEAIHPTCKRHAYRSHGNAHSDRRRPVFRMRRFHRRPASDLASESASDTADDEKVTDGNAFLNAMKEIANNKTAREIAKGVSILAAVLIIYECGLIIPFALLGGLAGGLIK